MKVALVTGASRGIGRACAVKLAEMGYYVIINFQSNEVEALNTLKMIREKGSDGEIMKFDVAVADEVEKAIADWQEAHEGEYVQCLVNNAGVRRDSLLFMMTNEDWNKVLDTSLNGFMYTTRAVLQPMLRKKNGRVVNMVSLSGQKGLPGQTNYSAAKGAVMAATKALAQEVARNFWNRHREAGVAAVGGLMQEVEAAFDAFYVFAPEEGEGFVMVAADDCVQPILAYSFHHRFDPAGKPNVLYWLGGYQEQIDWARSRGVEADEAVAKEWRRYTGGIKDGPEPPQPLTAVAPLMTTIWDQTGSSTKRTYNKFTPNDYSYSGKIYSTPTGCTATAMAQVMRYWKHPLRGTGSYSYNLTNLSSNGSAQTFSADFSQVSFDWDRMPYALSSGSSDAQINAVATLMFHCGVAVNMIYGLESSSTFTAFANNMTTALSRYFGYDASTLRSLNRSQYTKDEWLQVIREELSAGRPVIYSGNSPSMGGHTWVVDGYDAEGRLHMNWGWLGRSNGYYDADLNVPGLDFSQKQSVVIGIRPVDDTETAVHSVSGGARDAGSEFYDLTGRRVGGTGAALRPGIYVSGGRKLIIH